MRVFCSPQRLGSYQLSIQWGTASICLIFRGPRYKSDHSPISRDEAENTKFCSSTCPFTFMAFSSIKQGDNYTFTYSLTLLFIFTIHCFLIGRRSSSWHSFHNLLVTLLLILFLIPLHFLLLSSTSSSLASSSLPPPYYSFAPYYSFPHSSPPFFLFYFFFSLSFSSTFFFPPRFIILILLLLIILSLLILLLFFLFSFSSSSFFSSSATNRCEPELPTKFSSIQDGLYPFPARF